jgi:uncharacterized membrane protein YgcG
MQMRVTMTMVSLGLGCALAVTTGCSSSQPSSGLWSCFDTGSQIACTKVSALTTADQDVNGDGTADHFVCADDDNDGHDRNRDHDQSGLLPGSGSDADHDGVDDALDCDERNECESLSNDANPDRHAGEVEAEHDGGEDDGGHHGGDSSGGGGSSGGSSGPEMHDERTCTAPKLP